MSNKEYIGIHSYRLKGPSSKTEKKLVDNWKEWTKDNPLSGYQSILDCLFTVTDTIKEFSPTNPKDREYRPIGPPTARDQIVAETIIQWLGTNVGQGFLNECGFYKKR